MSKHVFRRSPAYYFKLSAALVLALAFALCACACGRTDPESGIQPASEPPASNSNVDITEVQRQRILELASAFRQFGEYGSDGANFAKMEHIVFCLYTDSNELESCDVEGFGVIPAETADNAIKSVFGNIEIMDVMRRKFDPEEDQTYYFKNGDYYIMRTDNSAYTYSIESVKYMQDDNGHDCHAAVVTVLREGKNEMDLIFTLMPNDDSVYRVEACDISLWY